MTKITTTEIHFTFCECNCSDTLFAKGERLTPKLLAAVKAVELIPVGNCHHNFEDGGCTVSVLLAESHLVVHLWPECAKTVVGDISVCNFSQNNYQKSLALLAELKHIFQPEKVNQWVFEGPGKKRGSGIALWMKSFLKKMVRIIKVKH
ncbi:S-adenosylmethionine decarboxylase [bacterium]|nr:S-adenosylmethionine decarboxylase [bacterium]